VRGRFEGGANASDAGGLLLRQASLLLFAGLLAGRGRAAAGLEGHGRGASAIPNDAPQNAQDQGADSGEADLRDLRIVLQQKPDSF
jgi:hypothetical protein